MECPKHAGKEVKIKECTGKGECEGWFDHACLGKPHQRRICPEGHFINVEAKPAGEGDQK